MIETSVRIICYTIELEVNYSTTKKLLFCNWLLFFGKSTKFILIPSVRMTLTMSKLFACIICQTIEWEVNYYTAKKMLFWLLLSILFSSASLSSSATVAPFASTGIRPVVNWLNQDTTVYYGLVFCAFSWPYMIKWYNSGLIMRFIHILVLTRRKII